MRVGLFTLALLVSAAAGAAPQSRPGGTGDANAHYDRGNALYEKGDLEGAIAELREAIRLKPDDAKAHYSLGVALRAKGDLDAAIPELREAIRLKPDFAEAHYNLGFALEGKGEKQAPYHDGTGQAALAEYRKASELDPGNKKFRAAYERLSKELKK